MPVRFISYLRQCVRTVRNAGRYAYRDRWRLLTWPFFCVLRMRRLRIGAFRSGTTILIANWQTHRFLETTIREVLRQSPRGTEVVVVDNASTDGSRAFLSGVAPRVRSVRLPVNVGHGLALDIAALNAHTEFVVALDVDAFPISSDWIERLAAPLHGDKTVSGAGASNGQIAPCCLMISLHRFLAQRHTFTARFVPGNDPWLAGAQSWDVGRGISLREGADRLHRFERTSFLDEENRVGEIFDGICYHNGYATVDMFPAGRGRATKATALAVWEEAERRFASNDDEGPDRASGTRAPSA